MKLGGPSPRGRRCRGAADEGLVCSIETGPSSDPFATLWVHLLPLEKGQPLSRMKMLRIWTAPFGDLFLLPFREDEALIQVCK